MLSRSYIVHGHVLGTLVRALTSKSECENYTKVFSEQQHSGSFSEAKMKVYFAPFYPQKLYKHRNLIYLEVESWLVISILKVIIR